MMISKNVLIVDRDDGFDEFRHLINEYLKDEQVKYLTCRESTDENLEFLNLFFSNDKVIDELLSLKTLSINITNESQLQFLILALQQIKSLVGVNVTINFSRITNLKLIGSLLNEYLRRKDDMFYVNQHCSDTVDRSKCRTVMDILLKSEMFIDPALDSHDLNFYSSLKRYEKQSWRDITRNLDSRRKMAIAFCEVFNCGFIYFIDLYL
jgi:hypothetical protein